MVNWGYINRTLNFFLGDKPKTGATGMFPEEMRLLAWNWAQSTFASHTALERTITLVVEPNDREVVAPPDLLDVGAIYDRTYEALYARQQLIQGGFRTEYGEDQTYWLWNGVIHFGQAVSDQRELTMDYYATWPALEYTFDADDKLIVTQPSIYTPSWAEVLLCHLTASQVLQPAAITAAMTRNYNSKMDSGSPDDNSRQKQAEKNLWWYTTLLSFHQPQSRVVGGN